MRTNDLISRWTVLILVAASIAATCSLIPTTISAASIPQRGQVASSKVIVSGHQGFDSCSNLTTSGLSTWWTNSPYWNVGFYLAGGETSVGAGCAQYGSSWRSTVSNQGWGFLPIWDGLQAPCGGKGPGINSNLSTAYQQGLNDATNATNAANAIGITNPTVIYLDMEQWPYSYQSACYWEVAYYISGWVKGMHNYGSSAGLYGNPGSTLLTEKNLAGNSSFNIPDDIWIAQYLAPDVTEYSTTYKGTPMNVWGVPYIPDGYWAYDQRHQQYTGGHYENSKWGYLGPTIDSDCDAGPVSNINYVHNTVNGDPYNEAYNEPANANEANGASEDSLCQ
jgi:Domain of unknown function (DUF1906)